VLSTLNLSFIIMAVISIQWVLAGYTLAFGSSINGLIGALMYPDDIDARRAAARQAESTGIMSGVLLPEP
jgi:ammonia channel protein AmtB